MPPDISDNCRVRAQSGGLTMPHIPVNHPLQPWYRLLAAAAGRFVLVFGIIGITRTATDPLFAHNDDEVFGLKLNLAFSIISVADRNRGAGRARCSDDNVDHFINIVGRRHLPRRRHDHDDPASTRPGLPELPHGDLHRVVRHRARAAARRALRQDARPWPPRRRRNTSASTTAPTRTTTGGRSTARRRDPRKTTRTGTASRSERALTAGARSDVGFASRFDRPFQARFTRCDATMSLRWFAHLEPPPTGQRDHADQRL